MNATPEQQHLNQRILEIAFDAWDRHCTALVNLLEALPETALHARALPSSPTIAEMFTHMHHERLISVQENAPEANVVVPTVEWADVPDPKAVVDMLVESAASVRRAVELRVHAGQRMDKDFAHPTQLMTFLIFHEGYHHGQIKLALKAVNASLPDDVVGLKIWDVWRAR